MLTQVSESEAKRLVTKKNIRRVFGADAVVDRAFAVHSVTKSRVEVYSCGNVNLFTISAPNNQLTIEVNIIALS